MFDNCQATSYDIHTMSRTGERLTDPKEVAHRAFPSAFAYFEGPKNATAKIIARLEVKTVVERGLHSNELDLLGHALRENNRCAELIEELETGNLLSVIVYFEGVARNLLEQADATEEGLIPAQKIGQALQELHTAQQKMPH